MSLLANLQRDLRHLANPSKAQILQRFFKTGPGEYGAGDVFLGIQVPLQRQIAKKYAQLKLNDLEKLFHSKIHEYRLVALLILVDQYTRGSQADKNKIFCFYLKNSRFINNWDLVDLSAPKIVGDYLFNYAHHPTGETSPSRHPNKKILYSLAQSKNLWQRRIAVISTLEFIRHYDFGATLKLAKILLTDRHDLIHKAVGWMLREVGKRDQKILEKFLNQHAHQMPRAMLRYALEKLPAPKRKHYLNK